MTIQEIVDSVRFRRSPTASPQQLIRSINNMEWRIKREIIDLSEERDYYPFRGYDVKDLNAKPLAPAPYDEIYIWACIYDLDIRENQLTNAYNSQQQRDALFGQLKAYWIRNHRPRAGKRLHSELYGI